MSLFIGPQACSRRAVYPLPVIGSGEVSGLANASSAVCWFGNLECSLRLSLFSHNPALANTFAPLLGRRRWGVRQRHSAARWPDRRCHAPGYSCLHREMECHYGENRESCAKAASRHLSSVCSWGGDGPWQEAPLQLPGQVLLSWPTCQAS